MTEHDDVKPTTGRTNSPPKYTVVMHESGMGAGPTDAPSGRPCYSFGANCDETSLEQAREAGIEV